jgi:hypothetical protein
MSIVPKVRSLNYYSGILADKIYEKITEHTKIFRTDPEGFSCGLKEEMACTGCPWGISKFAVGCTGDSV